MTPAWRSCLFVGADQPERIAKVATRGADAVILDLEDAVPQPRKAAARAALGEAIDGLAAQGQPLVVRVNASDEMVADLMAAVRAGVQAIMVPNAACEAQLGSIAEKIAELEAARHLPFGEIGLIALVESAAGVLNLPRLAAAPRVIGLALGSEDLSLDMGAPPSRTLLDLPARQIALAAHAYGRMALAAPISIAAYGDKAAYRQACLDGRAVGVTGAICIHPDQVEIANAVFGPGQDELAEAHAILAAWAQRGDGGVVSLDGRMIDLPVVERARRLLSRAPDVRSAQG